MDDKYNSILHVKRRRRGEDSRDQEATVASSSLSTRGTEQWGHYVEVTSHGHVMLFCRLAMVASVVTVYLTAFNLFLLQKVEY